MDICNVKSIIQAFYHWEQETPDSVFLRQPEGDRWHTLSFAQAGQEARKIASYLAACGLRPGDHVGILSKNCYHWVLADLAIMMGGYVSVPYYASLPKAQLEEVVELSDVKLIFIGKLDSWGDRKEAVSDQVKVVKFPQYANNAVIDIGVDWNDITAQSQPLDTFFSPKPDDLWTIKFTSGTTGKPKGVMHLHGTPIRMMQDEKESGWMGFFDLPEVRCISFLPLNHVGERVAVEVPAIYCGGSISFSESLEAFPKNLRDIQPTLIFAVPRIWTKFYSGVIAKVSPKKLDLLLRMPLVSKLVKRKLKTQMGMRDLKIAATGAAITPAFIKDFFGKLDIHLIEAYGMTEVCGSMCNSPDRDTPHGSVGQAIPHGEVKIDPKTQEVLMKTPYIMHGYYKDQQKTDEVLVDGWMHSGDRGAIDENGYVQIIGRVNDAFKTAKGSFITPNPMEEELSKNDYVEQVCVAGLGLTQPIAMVNLSEVGLAASKPNINESLTTSLETLNSQRAKHEHISTIIVCIEPWTEKNRLLTPTLKVKRGEVDERYRSCYSDWHGAPETVVWF